jgi:hypothetical protein
VVVAAVVVGTTVVGSVVVLGTTVVGSVVVLGTDVVGSVVVGTVVVSLVVVATEVVGSTVLGTVVVADGGEAGSHASIPGSSPPTCTMTASSCVPRNLPPATAASSTRIGFWPGLSTRSELGPTYTHTHT